MLVQRLETVANIAIIVVAILLSVVLVKHFILTRPADENRQQARNSIRKGERVGLKNIDWAKNGTTVLLALHKDCRFCSESAPFYKKLVLSAAQRSDVHLVAVLPQPTEVGRKYLNDLGVAIEDVREEQLAPLTIQGTPTLIIVDNMGLARDVWIGKLKPEQEAEVLKRF